MTSKVNLRAADLLESAALALAIPTVWGKGAEARRSDGTTLDISNPKACTFCAVGAIQAANLEMKVSDEVFAAAQGAIHEAVGNHRLNTNSYSIVAFNDDRNKKAPVLEVFGAAIDALRGL